MRSSGQSGLMHHASCTAFSLTEDVCDGHALSLCYTVCIICMTILCNAGQVPMVFMTEYLKTRAKSDQVGNFIFWISFCIIGQPISLILYYHDWVLLNRPAWIQAIDRAKTAGM